MNPERKREWWRNGNVGLRSSFQKGGRKPAELGLGRKRRVFRTVAGSGALELLRDYAQ